MGIATEQLKFDEWCPSCGNGVDRLHPITGFCFKCSQSIDGKTVCENCGEDFTPYQNSRKTCLKCRNLQWLERNADSIERVMVHFQINAIQAIQRVYDDNRPRCAMCGDKIKHGTRGRTTFCKKRDECRRAAVRFYNYRKRNNMSDDEALERALHGRQSDLA